MPFCAKLQTITNEIVNRRRFSASFTFFFKKNSTISSRWPSNTIYCHCLERIYCVWSNSNPFSCAQQALRQAKSAKTSWFISMNVEGSFIRDVMRAKCVPTPEIPEGATRSLHLKRHSWQSLSKAWRFLWTVPGRKNCRVNFCLLFTFSVLETCQLSAVKRFWNIS